MNLEKTITVLPLSYIEGVLVGKIGSYPYTIKPIHRGITSTNGYGFALKGEITNQDFSVLKKVSKNYLLSLSKIGAATILSVPSKHGISSKGETKDLPELESLVSTLNELGYEPITECPLSGLVDNLVPKVIDHVLLNIDLAAYDKLLEAKNQLIIDEKARIKFLPLSIIFALIGAIVGAIPTILIAQAGYILSILTALIPIASFFGYKLGKAPRTYLSIVIVVIFSLIAGVGTVFVNYIIEVNSVGVTLSEALSISEIASDFIRDLVVAAIFSLLGVYISWRYLKNQMIK